MTDRAERGGEEPIRYPRVGVGTGPGAEAGAGAETM